MKSWIRGVRGVVGVPSLLVLALLAGCGGGDGDTEGTQTQSTGGSGGSGGAGGSSGAAGSSGNQSGGSGGTSAAGSGGSGQAGDAGAGQAGDAGAGQAGSGGSGQAGDAGSGQAGDAGSGQAGDAGSGQAGDAGSGQAGDAGVGGDAGSGQAGDGGAAGSGGSGQAGDAGSGQGGDAGSGQGGDAGSGQGGSPGGCCKEDKDCAGPDPVVLVCVGGQCKLPASKGECWEDDDCGGGFTCEGEFICPCGALCGPLGDTTGKCVPLGTGCCKADEECQKQGLDQCVEGTCREKLPAGQCWDADDCKDNQACQNAAPCPCGLLCGQDSPGKCVDVVDNCCKEDKDCGAGGDCVGSVCKKPAPVGQCWEDDDCGGGFTCEGEIVCPCGALCILPDTPGKCQDGGSTPACCKEDKTCGDKNQCVLPLGGGIGSNSEGVCKPLLTDGTCWDNGDCKQGTACKGQQVCPCNADCIVPDSPGKCL